MLQIQTAGAAEALPIEQWKKHLAARYTGSTPYTYLWCLKKFIVWCQARGEQLADVRQPTIESYLAELRGKFKPNGVRQHYKCLRCFFDWLEEETGAANPMRKIKSPKIAAGVHQRDALTDEEVSALIASCESTPIGVRDRAMICLMAYCALRQIEVQRTDLGDMETREGRMILWVMGKGRAAKDAYVVLPPPAENALRDWLAVRPGPLAGAIFTGLSFGHTLRQQRLTVKQIRIVVHRRLLRIGINNPRKTTHSLRHSAITNAIRHGAKPLQAMAMARHADLRNTLTYYHESDRLEQPAEDLIAYSNTGAEEKISNDQKLPPAD